MKYHRHAEEHFTNRHGNGFALVATILLMVLLAIITVGTLSLSVVTIRSSNQDSAQAMAKANARLALMIAIGELQKEMGPDMRISAQSAILDSDPNTSEINGIEQSRWMASYHSWGNWLNDTYTLPGSTNTLSIQDTYNRGREPMFRRWLLSLPENKKSDINAPASISDWNDTNSVIMVGDGTLGPAATSNPDQKTRAYLLKVNETGRYAWWIAPENHKAKANLATQTRSLALDEWEVSAGNTGEVGVSALNGFGSMEDYPEEAEKLHSQNSMQLLSDVTNENAKQKFFDLTTSSTGLLTNVRTGGLKKDLSLLFEKNGSELPEPYLFNEASDLQEPSIRPMSPEIANLPQIRGRHFQSWTNMRHFYRMYRSDTDATHSAADTARRNFTPATVTTANRDGGTGGLNRLTWSSSDVRTELVSSCNIGYLSNFYYRWMGANSYWRRPVMTKLTYLYSTLVIPNAPPTPPNPQTYNCRIAHTPVLTYWNPYNISLRIPSAHLGVSMGAYNSWPMHAERYLGNTYLNTGGLSGTLGRGLLSSLDGSDIVFKPGEFIQFSPRQMTGAAGTSQRIYLYPGFDPQAYGGLSSQIEASANPANNRGFALTFGNTIGILNINEGNTPGSVTYGQFWTMDYFTNSGQSIGLPGAYQNDWFKVAQLPTPITPSPRGAYVTAGPVTYPQNIIRWNYSDPNPTPFAYAQMVMKSNSTINYDTVNWSRDWRGRNWIYSPSHYYGSGLYASENDTLLHTQRLENPYVINFGEVRGQIDLARVVNHHPSDSSKPFLGSGSNPYEKINRAPAIELPTAPITSLAGFSGMRINPGWTQARSNFPHLFLQGATGSNISWSLYSAEHKVVAYQSGVTGPGIGNSFMHPMLNRNSVYRFVDNSISQDPNANRLNWAVTVPIDTKAYCDYWDHVFLLNDALWDEYFLSSLARQSRDTDASVTANIMIDRMLDGTPLPNSRYLYSDNGLSKAKVAGDLKGADGYLKTANHLLVDGMFNVNSTSVDAWHALFSGIRERKLVRRNGSQLQQIATPADKKIAISRFNTAVFSEESSDPEYGVEDGSDNVWSDVRFLSDTQLRRLAEECVKQVKRRGPFLNFSEFINRRLSNDDLGTMGALQSAIDYDDENPDPESINYKFKNGGDIMMTESDLGTNDFGTPEAAEGSRFAGIPGYVIQSDLLKPIANTLSVRDDTFTIRAYGESRDSSGKVLARAWCEAIVQRGSSYVDSSNENHEPSRISNTDGSFDENTEITITNRSYGRKFHITNFRWIHPSEI